MERFDSIIRQYSEAFREFGDDPKSVLTPKGRSRLRYRILERIGLHKNFSIIDYGCGLAFLKDFLEETSLGDTYIGVDIVPEFINHCKAKTLKNESGKLKSDFLLLNKEEELSRSADVVFCSGVFNLKYIENTADNKRYVLEKLIRLTSQSEYAFVCDFLSKNVDFEQEGAQHFSVAEIIDFLESSGLRKYSVHHDLLPYEFTIVVYKDTEIGHPESIYKTDLK